MRDTAQAVREPLGRLRASPTERIYYHVALAFEVDGIPEGNKVVTHKEGATMPTLATM